MFSPTIIMVNIVHLWFVYRQLPGIFNRYSSAEGFLFLHDDTILNYWNLLQADKTKLWITDKVIRTSKFSFPSTIHVLSKCYEILFFLLFWDLRFVEGFTEEKEKAKG